MERVGVAEAAIEVGAEGIGTGEASTPGPTGFRRG
jgi:hypothetical protein